MRILQCWERLLDDFHCFLFWKCFIFFLHNHVEKFFALTELRDYVEILAVFIEFIDFKNIWVIKILENIDFF